MLGNLVDGLGGLTYGPVAFGGFPGGSTAWVTSSYVVEPGDYFLFWEVADVIDIIAESAVVTDRVMLGGSLLFDFESGLAGFTTFGGQVGTSPAVPGLTPTSNDNMLFLDTTDGQDFGAAIFDLLDAMDVTQVRSPTFTVSDTALLSFDAAFVTNDGAEFHDYGVIALFRAGLPSAPVILWTGDTHDEIEVIPEPGTLALLGFGAMVLLRRRRRIV